MNLGNLPDPVPSGVKKVKRLSEAKFTKLSSCSELV